MRLPWPIVAQCGLLICACGTATRAQQAPTDPHIPWQSGEQTRFHKELGQTSAYSNLATVDFTKTYSLSELIDLGERRNPQTQIAWDRAKQQAAQLGIARATLFPFLTSAIVGGTSNAQILLGPAFAGQDIQSVQPLLALYYTVFDFGRRKDMIDAAKFNTFSSNFSFNDVHQRVIFDVTASYYQLLGAKGEVEAAEASLKNAQTVQDAVEARLKNGLATLPDALEARSGTAQSLYELERARGVERVSQARLSQAVNVPPTQTLLVEDISKAVTIQDLRDSVDNAIQRALQQRPDLLAQMAKVDSAQADTHEARANFFPTLSFDGYVGHEWLRGTQTGDSTIYANGPTWLAELQLKWTVFDGKERNRRLDLAKAQESEAKSQLALLQEQAQVEVWTAYSNVQIALRQLDAANAFEEAASNSYAAVLEAYRYGVKNFLDVTSSQRTLAQAQTALVQAKATLLTDVADLAFQTGDLLKARGTGRIP
ncbi:MAG TPA: TolC family protein [Methylomirabilota bacterium]|nr:TolC family protein [Methylomirabilota bacterium]